MLAVDEDEIVARRFAMRAISPERASRTSMPSATLPAFNSSFTGFTKLVRVRRHGLV